MSSSPVLPLELEMTIFKLCALSLPVFIPKLMLVAHRVKEWVEPILYHTICICADGWSAPEFPRFTQDTVASLITQKPAAFFRKHVHHLTLIDETADGENGKLLLAMCSDAENLWIGYTDNTWVPLVEYLPLKRLDIDLELFLSLEPTQPIFSRLTHLTLDQPAAASALARLPMLSHLALSWQHDHAAEYSQDLALETLVVFIVLSSSPSKLAAKEEIVELAKDLRFVIMPLQSFIRDWHSGIRNGKDYWSDAEAFVAMRQTQGANAVSCFWQPADSDTKSDAA
ncbi:hypothetical protein R3P38DRAFT_2857197 [Favolaschia claudopus]|uniref:Uncharacterized protein n=1 Tax=Favolaschia claudopus TaxID=2862362 RepID=A0AAW0DIF6_9AGAR